ncbi:hypothetical protein ROHU_032591 [Labeo rohita]|uniref:Uncharacterized protein n=1 Tax=Labeo rohita TaxID=84645 RepID=A0A498LBQ9_LABRO|nr:hypothetical protein ROHU_033756 [Labeo rohita]RXN06975.1 hypothetical protein ROHU_032591 [Labeo rohita]
MCGRHYSGTHEAKALQGAAVEQETDLITRLVALELTTKVKPKTTGDHDHGRDDDRGVTGRSGGSGGTARDGD